jgi:hypothetical protein
MQSSQPTLEPHSRVILVEYKLCTHSCFLYTSFGYLRLLLSSRRRGGLHQQLRRLLGASSPSRRPCGDQLRREFRICFYASAVSDIFVIHVIIIHSYSLIISFYVTCVMISWWFCCIYAWLDRGAYIIARFMFFVNPVLHPLIPSPN